MDRTVTPPAPGAVAHLLLLRHRSPVAVLALCRRVAALTGGYSPQLATVEAHARAAQQARVSGRWAA